MKPNMSVVTVQDATYKRTKSKGSAEKILFVSFRGQKYSRIYEAITQLEES
jgi:hypothetical protein